MIYLVFILVFLLTPIGLLHLGLQEEDGEACELLHRGVSQLSVSF